MENIITKTNEQFGSIRTIEGKPQLWCGSDVAKALGYTNPQKAIRDHCKAGTERNVQHPQNPKKSLAMKFIPEADVYRLICHSKLPKAQEFEKWVFEDVVPEAVHECEQLTFDNYEYFDKTFNGQPVLTSEDISRLAGIRRSGINWQLKKPEFKHGTDYFRLEGRTLAEFKRENPKYTKQATCVNIITKSGFDKLIAYFGAKVDTPKLFIEEKPKPIQPTAPEEPQYTPSDSMVSLLGYIDRQMILIAEYRRRLLSTCSLRDAEVYKKELANALRDLKWFHFDTETIRIG